MSLTETPYFNGFTTGTFRFFSSLERNNNVNWFADKKDIYEKEIVLPSKAFVSSIGEFFNFINPQIRTAPKFNETLMRINKDMRFHKGTPYKTYFLIHFGRFKMDSEFYVYLDKKGISYGIFLNNSKEENLFFNRNINKYYPELINTFAQFKLNRKFNLFKMIKEPELLKEKFDASKQGEVLKGMKYILLEKFLPLDHKLTYSQDLLNECIKTFSRLYPLYCFAVSPDPLTMLKDFEERAGAAV